MVQPRSPPNARLSDPTGAVHPQSTPRRRGQAVPGRPEPSNGSESIRFQAPRRYAATVARPDARLATVAHQKRPGARNTAPVALYRAHRPGSRAGERGRTTRRGADLGIGTDTPRQPGSQVGLRPIWGVRRHRRHDCFHSRGRWKPTIALATKHKPQNPATGGKAHECSRPHAAARSRAATPATRMRPRRASGEIQGGSAVRSRRRLPSYARNGGGATRRIEG
jgi:hypothetical protein